MTQYAVTLDLWNTLIGEDVAGETSRRRNAERVNGTLRVLREAGEEVPRQALEDAFARVHRLIDADHTRGLDMTFDDRVRQVLSLVAPGLPERADARTLAHLGAALDGPFLAHPPRMLPGAVGALKTLADQDVVLAIISNTGLTSPGGYGLFLEARGVRRFFRVLSFSTGHAVAKPTESIFRATLEMLGVQPWAALHVGDDLHADVAGAFRAGLRTAWISGVDSSQPEVTPDFTISEIAELPAVVQRWLREPPSPPQ